MPPPAQVRGARGVPRLLRAASLRTILGEQDSCGVTEHRRGMELFEAYCAGRLVLEGGFPPEWVAPRQPYFSRRLSNAEYELGLTSASQEPGARRVLGGVKHTDLNVAVVLPELGPALGIAARNTADGFDQLPNGAEDALGECTNVHLMHPGLIFGFLHLIKFAKQTEVANVQDASFGSNDEPLAAIQRYHDVMLSLGGRRAITDPGMRYEAVGLLIYRCTPTGPAIWEQYPPADSPAHFLNFFQQLYDLYDVRFGYPDPNGPNVRKAWRPQFKGLPEIIDKNLPFRWQPRLAESDGRTS